MAVIRFSHPWKSDQLKTTIHRTICQDSTAYFLSVLSIQIFVTVAITSGAPVSSPVTRNAKFPTVLTHSICPVPSGSFPRHVSGPHRYNLNFTHEYDLLHLRTNV
jgi:hypothetical protein